MASVAFSKTKDLSLLRLFLTLAKMGWRNVEHLRRKGCVKSHPTSLLLSHNSEAEFGSSCTALLACM